MATAGYSGTPLIKKLGIKPEQRLAFLSAPEHFTDLLGPLPADLVPKQRLSGRFDFIHLFVKRRADLERRVPALIKALVADGTLWISWPKRSSGVASDISEDILREVLLPTGVVDVKVCAVDETWSGLKFMWRKDRR